MKFRIVLLTGLICAALPVAPASANTVNIIANLGVNPTSITSAPLVVHTAIAAGAFQDAYTFTVAGGSGSFITTGVASNTYADSFSQIAGFNVSIWRCASLATCGTAADVLVLGPGAGILAPPPGSQFASVSGLVPAGAYYFDVAGVASGGLGAAYNGSVDTAAAPPIPEPETYAMMLAGLGLMGFVARRRRQKSD